MSDDKEKQALAALNNLPALGDLLRSLSTRIRDLEGGSGQTNLKEAVSRIIRELEARITARFAEQDKRIEELESALDNVLESAFLKDLAKRLEFVEESLTAPAVASTQAPKPKKKPKVGLIGCLPRQANHVKEKLPDVEVIFLSKATAKKNLEVIFIAAGVADTNVLQEIESKNPGRVIRMMGGLTTWVSTINEWVQRHAA